MALPVEYVARETATNLWRNRMMALAAVLTVAVSLTLVGTSLLLRQGVNRQITQLGDNVSVQVFVNANATKGQTAYIRSLIAQTPQIQGGSCTYLDHRQSYERMRSLFANEPTIAGVLTPATTPPVFECQVKNPNDSQVVAAVFNGVPGVYKASYPGQAIQSFEKLANVLQSVFLGMAIILLISSLALILNAIRMAIAARGREIGVMKLVGATNWFIRVPFMLEGFVQGAIGSAVAIVAVLLANLLVTYLVKNDGAKLLASSSLPTGQLLVIEAIVLVIGLVVGVAGSSLAVRKHLEV